MRTSIGEMVVRAAMVAVGWIFCFVARGEGESVGMEARCRERERRRGVVSTRRMMVCCDGEDELGWR